MRRSGIFQVEDTVGGHRLGATEGDTSASGGAAQFQRFQAMIDAGNVGTIWDEHCDISLHLAVPRISRRCRAVIMIVGSAFRVPTKNVSAAGAWVETPAPVSFLKC